MNEFFIGIQILLAALIESCMFIQASRGGGKSFLMRKLIEVFSGHCQQIIIDLEGEFVTLREKYPFALLAVEGGDIALNVKHAATYAKKFMESQMSVIIDISDLVPRDREIFVRDFLHALMHLPKNLYHPLLLYIDEVAKFCPQDETALSTAAVIDVAARGRKRDIGVIAATQRVSNVHKDLTSEMGNKMIGRTYQDIDQVRAGKQLGWKPAQSTGLRSIKPGEFFCYGPALQDDIMKFKVQPVETSHKKMGSRTIAPPTPEKIKALISSLSDLPAEAENDLKTMTGLQEEVTRLNHMLTKSGKQPISALEKIEEIQAPLRKEIMKMEYECAKLEGTVDRLKTVISAIGSLAAEEVPPELFKKMEWLHPGEKLSFPPTDVITGVVYPYSKIGDMPIIKSEDLGKGKEREFMDYGNGMRANGPVKDKEKPWAELVVTRTEDVPREEPPIGKMGRTILHFLYRYDAGFTDYQLAFGCEYSHTSGSFKDALRQLKRMGYVKGDKDALFANTEKEPYADVCKIIDMPVQTKLTSVAYWDKLGAMERNIASYIHMSHVSLFSADGIAEACKYAPTSGSFKDAIRNLAKLELILREGKNILKNRDVPIV